MRGAGKEIVFGDAVGGGGGAGASEGARFGFDVGPILRLTSRGRRMREGTERGYQVQREA